MVLTCGGFENNQEMIRNYLPGVPYCYTSGSPYNEGDGITMAQSVGADLWHMNNYAGPSMALKVPEFRTSFSMQALHYSKQMPGGMIVVGPDARRFADEKFKTRHGKIPVNGRWLPLSTPCPMFLICDHTLFSAGPLYDKHPSHGWTQIIERYEWSADNRAELANGWIKRADSLAALAAVLGLDPAALGRHRRPMEPLLRRKARPGFRPHPDAGADRRGSVLCGGAVALDAQHARRPAPQREGADRAPRRHADSHGSTAPASWDRSTATSTRAPATSASASPSAASPAATPQARNRGSRNDPARRHMTASKSEAYSAAGLAAPRLSAGQNPPYVLTSSEIVSMLNGPNLAQTIF